MGGLRISGYAALVVAAVGVAAAGATVSCDGPDPSPSPARALGALCSQDASCASGRCVEGVCCDRACDSGCEACNVVGATGTCLPTPGPDPDGSCGAGAVCSASAECVAGHRVSLMSASGGIDEITAATAGPAEDLMIGGRFTAELRFGAEPVLLGDPARAAAFVARLDAHRIPRWALSVGVGATVDALARLDDVVFVAGTHSGEAPLFGLPRQAEGVDGFVAALDDGGVRWIWFFEGPGTQRIDRLAALADGGVVVGARDQLEEQATLSAAVVALDGRGVTRWSVPVSSPGNDRVGALAVASDGAILVAGAINGPVTVGRETLAHRGAEDVVVLRLSPAGEVDRAWSFGGAGSDVGQAIVPGPDGDLFLAGFFTKGIDFGDGPMLSAGCEDVFLVRLDPEGRARFSRRYGDAEPQVVSGLAMTADGQLVAAGDFEGDLDVGWGPLVGRGELDLWVASWTLDGVPTWATSFGGPDRERAHAFALTGDGIVVAGRAHGPLDFGDTTLVPVGAADGFVAELSR